jgi:DNA-binding response OmpR family regulator
MRTAAVTSFMERGGERVLVVDDEAQVSMVVRFSLEAEGYETFGASDGDEAMEQVRSHRPTLVVLDIMMPRRDGWSVLEELSRLPETERPRVVMVSALSNGENRSRAAALGASAFVAKPFDIEHLLGVLRTLDRAS